MYRTVESLAFKIRRSFLRSSISAVLMALCAVVTHPTWAQLSIMPLGDSITAGGDGRGNRGGGYRQRLWCLLKEAGFADLRFVGTLSDGPTSPACDLPMPSWDRNHEGHPGSTIDTLRASVCGWIAQLPPSQPKPNVILLKIGSADVLRNISMDQAPARLSALIDEIFSCAGDDITVMVATILPFAEGSFVSGMNVELLNQRASAYNAALPNVVSEKVAEGKRVALVDMSRRWSAMEGSHFVDGVHPTPRGYENMAWPWYEAIVTQVPSIPAGPPPIEWQRAFGGEGFGNMSEAYSARQTTDGGFIVVGHTMIYEESHVHSGVYLVKTDTEGNVLWQKTIGAGGYEVGFCVQQTSDNGYIVSGTTSSVEGRENDVYLFKTDNEGNLLWERTFGGEGNDRGQSVQQTTDGGFIVAGTTGVVGSGDADVYVFKTNANGNLLWQQSFGGASDDSGMSVEQTADEGFIVVGTTESYGEGKKDVYLLKISPEGNLLWEETYGGAEDDYGASVKQTVDNHYIIAGQTESFGAGWGDVYLLKADSQGELQWQQTFGEEELDYSMSIELTDDGGFIVTGTTWCFGAEQKDVYLLKTDSEGSLRWQRVISVGVFDYARCVRITSDGGYIVAGATDDFNTGNAFLLKTDAEGHRVWDVHFGKEALGRCVQETSDGGFIVVGTRGSTGRHKILLVKTDTHGNSLWENTYGDGYDSYGYQVEETTDGGYIVAGNSSTSLPDSPGFELYLFKTDKDGQLLWKRKFSGEHSVGPCWLQGSLNGGYIAGGVSGVLAYFVKIDGEGNLQWEKNIGHEDLKKLTSARQTSDGGFILLGWTESLGAGGYDILLVKTDPDGFPVWEKTFGGEGNEYGTALHENPDGSYVVVGLTNSFGPGEGDVYFLKIDPNGQLLWQKTLGGEGTGNPSSVQRTRDGGYTVGGSTSSFGAVWSDVYIAKTDHQGNLLWERSIAGSDNDYGHFVKQTKDGGYVVTGSQGMNLFLAKLAPEGTAVFFRRGDANSDSEMDISDAVFILSYLFLGKSEPTCEKSGDTDDNGVLEITDAIRLLGYLFLGGPAPQAPFLSCGIDLTGDQLSCEEFSGCQ